MKPTSWYAPVIWDSGGRGKRTKVQGYDWLHSKFGTNLGYLPPYLVLGSSMPPQLWSRAVCVSRHNTKALGISLQLQFLPVIPGEGCASPSTVPSSNSFHSILIIRFQEDEYTRCLDAVCPSLPCFAAVGQWGGKQDQTFFPRQGFAQIPCGGGFCPGLRLYSWLSLMGGLDGSEPCLLCWWQQDDTVQRSIS